jgi:hypothetical protein
MPRSSKTIRDIQHGCAWPHSLGATRENYKLRNAYVCLSFYRKLNATVIPFGPLHVLKLWPVTAGVNEPIVSTLNASDRPLRRTWLSSPPAPALYMPLLPKQHNCSWTFPVTLLLEGLGVRRAPVSYGCDTGDGKCGRESVGTLKSSACRTASFHIRGSLQFCRRILLWRKR